MAARVMDSLRTEQDIAQATPAWFGKLARRIAKLQGGRVHNLVIVIPLHGEPFWSFIGDSPLENHHDRHCHE